MRDEPETAHAIVSAYLDKSLTAKILDDHLTDEDALNRECVRLHNDGKIDLLTIAEEVAFQELEGPPFFVVQQFLCEAIPDLSAAVTVMMNFVQNLVRKGGRDGAAGFPNLAFQKWCERDVARAQKVIEAASMGEALGADFLAFALTAGNSADVARNLITQYTDRRRLSAITALGRMKFSAHASLELLSFLLELLSGPPDDDLSAHVLKAATDIAAKANLVASNEMLKILQSVADSPGPATQYFGACMLFNCARDLTAEQVALLTSAMESVDPSHKGTLDELDLALMKLLATEHQDKSSDLVSSILLSANGTLTISAFDSFGRSLANNNASAFSRTIVKWLLSGQHRLCDALSQLMRYRSKSQQPLVISSEDLDLSDRELVFLCRKAIGYFFVQPIVAASVLLSVLRAHTDRMADAISGLLFDPLLINYGVALQKYLSSIEHDDPVFPCIRNVLERNEAYLKALHSKVEVKELHPSSHQRRMERIRLTDEMHMAHKKAQGKSVLLNLVKRMVLLHGKQAVTYVREPEGGHRWVEIEMKELSVQFEMPRIETVDTVGLEFLITMFRLEKLKS
jgi:hypothetical protein